jgi:hypothetical protein
VKTHGLLLAGMDETVPGGRRQIEVSPMPPACPKNREAPSSHFLSFSNMLFTYVDALSSHSTAAAKDHRRGTGVAYVKDAEARRILASPAKPRRGRWR